MPFRLSGRTDHPEPPGWVAAKARPDVGEAALFRELVALGASNSQLDVFRFLTDASTRFGRPGTYMSLRTMSAESGIPLTTLRLGIKWLVDRSFVVRTRERTGGRNLWMIWCLWLLDPPPSYDSRSARKPDGHGARNPVDKELKWMSSKERSVNVSAALAQGGGDGPPSEVASPAPIVEAPIVEEPIVEAPIVEASPVQAPIVEATAEMPAEEVAELVARVRSNARRFERRFAYDALSLAGMLPADLVGAFKPLEADLPGAGPTRPAVVASPAPALSLAPRAADTEAKMRRLACPMAGDALAALADDLADEMARQFNDPAWRNCFRKRVHLTGLGRLALKPLIKAYNAARRSDSETRGRIWVDLHNKALGHAGGPIESFFKEANP